MEPNTGDGGEPPLVEVLNVRMNFGGIVALDDVSLTVSAGMTVGLVGANGSGKTTLLNCISGLYQYTGGDVRILGRSVRGLRPHQISLMGVGRTLQGVETISRMRVIDYVLLGRQGALRSSVAAYLVGWPHLRGLEARERETAWRALSTVGAGAVAMEEVGNVPYGVAKLVDLARVLCSSPRVVLMDEPASGLARHDRDHLAEVIKNLALDGSRAVVVVEHDLSLAQSICDSLALMSLGKIVATGDPVEVLGSDAARDTLFSSGGTDMEEP